MPTSAMTIRVLLLAASLAKIAGSPPPDCLYGLAGTVLTAGVIIPGVTKTNHIASAHPTLVAAGTVAPQDGAFCAGCTLTAAGTSSPGAGSFYPASNNGGPPQGFLVTTKTITGVQGMICPGGSGTFAAGLNTTLSTSTSTVPDCTYILAGATAATASVIIPGVTTAIHIASADPTEVSAGMIVLTDGAICPDCTLVAGGTVALAAGSFYPANGNAHGNAPTGLQAAPGAIAPVEGMACPGGSGIFAVTSSTTTATTEPVTAPDCAYGLAGTILTAGVLIPGVTRENHIASARPTPVVGGTSAQNGAFCAGCFLVAAGTPFAAGSFYPASNGNANGSPVGLQAAQGAIAPVEGMVCPGGSGMFVVTTPDCVYGSGWTLAGTILPAGVIIPGVTKEKHIASAHPTLVVAGTAAPRNGAFCASCLLIAAGTPSPVAGSFYPASRGEVPQGVLITTSTITGVDGMICPGGSGMFAAGLTLPTSANTAPDCAYTPAGAVANTASVIIPGTSATDHVASSNPREVSAGTMAPTAGATCPGCTLIARGTATPAGSFYPARSNALTGVQTTQGTLAPVAGMACPGGSGIFAATSLFPGEIDEIAVITTTTSRAETSLTTVRSSPAETLTTTRTSPGGIIPTTTSRADTSLTTVRSSPAASKVARETTTGGAMLLLLLATV